MIFERVLKLPLTSVNTQVIAYLFMYPNLQTIRKIYRTNRSLFIYVSMGSVYFVGFQGYVPKRLPNNPQNLLPLPVGGEIIVTPGRRGTLIDKVSFCDAGLIKVWTFLAYLTHSSITIPPQLSHLPVAEAIRTESSIN